MEILLKVLSHFAPAVGRFSLRKFDHFDLSARLCEVRGCFIITLAAR